MDELINAIKNSLKKKESGKEYIMMNSHYVPVSLSINNFHSIQSSAIQSSDLNDFNDSNELSKLTFIDGGQAILYDTPGLAIGFLRIGAITYDKLKKIDKTKSEFYILVSLDKGFVVHTFPKTAFDGMTFDPDDELLKSGIDRCLPSRIISVIRRYAELELAAKYNFSVLDGTLEARYPNESGYISQLKNAIAISKTCALTLNTGESVTRRLYSMKKGTWGYYPVVENRNQTHQAEIFFVKLHDKSKHVFRTELNKRVASNISLLNKLSDKIFGNVFGALMLHSNDPVFYGYPYGLIAVDEYVRVSEEESGFLKTKLNMKLGKSFNELELEEHAVDAHSILDGIKF
jgi:hypothetical protein